MRLKAWHPPYTEIKEYIIDLNRVTSLRDKCDLVPEKERYNTVIQVMQEVLIFLNQPPKKK